MPGNTQREEATSAFQVHMRSAIMRVCPARQRTLHIPHITTRIIRRTWSATLCLQRVCPRYEQPVPQAQAPAIPHVVSAAHSHRGICPTTDPAIHCDLPGPRFTFPDTPPTLTSLSQAWPARALLSRVLWHGLVAKRRGCGCCCDGFVAGTYVCTSTATHTSGRVSRKSDQMTETLSRPKCKGGGG